MSAVLHAETNAPDTLFTVRGGWPCHTAEYAGHRLAWDPASGPIGLRAIHPHPLVSATVYATAADGLYRSDDDAATWRRLPLVGLGDPSAITAVAFRPDEIETIALGTRAQGVWLTTDGGQTARQIGSMAAGLAAEAIACLVYTPGDVLHRTLLAGHGRNATGVSRGDTRSGSWTVAAPDMHVFRILPGNPHGRELYLFASQRITPDAVEIYYASVLGAYWQRLVADAQPTDGAWFQPQQAMYLTTLDKGILRCSSGGGTLQELGGADTGWFGAFTTWDAHADQERLGLYQPSRLGCVWTTNDLDTVVGQSHGLQGGTLVSDTSRIRPNAGGTRFYGAINGVLWIGRDTSARRIDSVSIAPGTITVSSPAMREEFWNAGQDAMRQYAATSRAGAMAGRLAATLHALNGAIPHATVSVQARVLSPTGTTPRVTADLSRLGLSQESPLTAQSNGLYALSFEITGETLSAAARRRDDWRASWPGPLAITVSATTPGERPVGAVGLFGLYTRPEDVTIGRDTWALYLGDTVGHVAFACERDDPNQYWIPLHQRLSVGPGAWCAPIWHLNLCVNLADYEALTFKLKSVGPADRDLSVHVCDRPNDAAPTMTPGLALAAGGYIDGGSVTTVYRRVTIPVADLLKSSASFNAELFAGIAFSGQSATNRTYLIDDLRLVVSRSDLAAEAGNTP